MIVQPFQNERVFYCPQLVQNGATCYSTAFYRQWPAMEQILALAGKTICYDSRTKQGTPGTKGA